MSSIVIWLVKSQLRFAANWDEVEPGFIKLCAGLKKAGEQPCAADLDDHITWLTRSPSALSVAFGSQFVSGSLERWSEQGRCETCVGLDLVRRFDVTQW